VRRAGVHGKLAMSCACARVRVAQSIVNLHFCRCFTEKAKQIVPDTTTYIPLIGSITRWHGDGDAIENAFNLWALWDEFVFTAIWEDQHKMKNNSQNTSADNMLDPELIVTDILSQDDWEDWKVNLNIPSPFKVWSRQLEGFSSQQNRPNIFVADVIPAIVVLQSHLGEA